MGSGRKTNWTNCGAGCGPAFFVLMNCQIKYNDCPKKTSPYKWGWVTLYYKDFGYAPSTIFSSYSRTAIVSSFSLIYCLLACLIAYCRMHFCMFNRV